ncbi:MAG: mechanosensitive ion channel family protein [Bacteriovoracaceae bacterium]
MHSKWIPVDKIQQLINYEVFAVTCVLIIIAYLFYYFFLNQLSDRRHKQLRERFFKTSLFVVFSGLTAGLHWILFGQSYTELLLLKITNYASLLALFLGAVAIIKVAQIYVYLYLFFSNITTGVPRLIGNLFTFVFSIFVFSSIGAVIFDFNIATLATTSAVFSLVLGLALQDTLGNFFSGLSIQIDRPFHIGNWVEILNGDQKWVGQIYEINWRATFLLSFSDELIMVPNKTIAQSQIIILTHNLRPCRISQAFRFSYDTDIEKAKKALLEGVHGHPDLMNNPAPTVLVTEVNESWIMIKVFYSLHDYGTRYRAGDIILNNIMKNIKQNNLKLAHQVLHLQQES